MTLLLNHLEQVASSARTIGELPFVSTTPAQKPCLPASRFPPPKIFTNALLGNHEITTLIRDTEPHERALFSIDPNAKALPTQRRSNRRTTTFTSDENRGPIPFNAGPRKQSAVARVLGSDMLHEIESYGGNATNRRPEGSKGVNVEVILKGAEKLCMV
jgi:DASH complex subunit Spc34